MKRLDESYTALWDRIPAANHDLRERLRAFGASVYYDPDEDTLSLRIDEAGPTMAETRDDLVWTYLHPQSLKIMGIEITGVEAFLAQHPEGRPGTERMIALALQAPGTFVRAPLEENVALGLLLSA